MNAYIHSIISENYITSLLTIIEEHEHKLHTETANNNIDQVSVKEIIDSYQETMEQISNIQHNEILTVHLKDKNKDIEKLSKILLSTSTVLSKEDRESILEFITPFLVRDNQQNYYTLLNYVNTLIIDRDRHGYYISNDDYATVLEKIRDIGIENNVDLLKLKKIIDSSYLSGSLKSIFANMEININTEDTLSLLNSFSKNKVFIDKNIGKIIKEVNSILENKEPNQDHIDIIKNRTLDIASSVINGFNDGYIDYETARKFINMQREQINKEQLQIPFGAIYDPIYYLKSNKDDIIKDEMSARALKNIHYHTSTIKKSLPLDNKEIDEFFSLIDTDFVFEDVIFSSVNYLDQDYFNKKITDRYQDEINLSFLRFDGFYRRDQIEKIVNYLGYKIDVLKEKNPSIPIVGFIDGEDLDSLSPLRIGRICKIIDSSKYLSNNLNEGFQWVSKELLETKRQETPSNSQYIFLNELLEQDTFKKWLLEDEQLKKDGITNQVIGGRRLSVRLLNPNSKDISENIQLVINKLNEKDDHSFKECYINNKPFKMLLEKSLSVIETDPSLDIQLREMVQKSKTELEQRALHIANQKAASKVENKKRMKI